MIKVIQEIINHNFNDPHQFVVNYRYCAVAIDKIKPFLFSDSMTPFEAYQIYMAVTATERIHGDIAEVGVFHGDSAEVICTARANDRSIHLFDTFQGLPEVQTIDEFNPTGETFRKGMYASTLETVQNRLKKYKDVYYYPGIFPATSRTINDTRFSFVNLDADLYQSTYEALEFFYPRMTKGGIIMCHDYNCQSYGVNLAIQNFFETRPEPIIELAGSQCLIVKI